MRTILVLAALGTMLWLTTGCTHAYYSPNMLNTSHVEKQHDLVVEGSGLLGFTHIGYDIHTAYSPFNHIAIMANGFQLKRKLATSDAYSWDKIGLFEAAAGVYQPTPAGTLGLYMGYGSGSVRSSFYNDNVLFFPSTATSYVALSDIALRRFFIQPTFTLQDKFLEFGLGARIIRLDYPNGTVDARLKYDSANQSNYEGIQFIEANRPFWATELGARFVVRASPCTIGMSGNLLFSNNNVGKYIDHISLALTFGINIHEMKKEKKVKS
jgi:hypothetical protein